MRKVKCEKPWPDPPLPEIKEFPKVLWTGHTKNDHRAIYIKYRIVVIDFGKYKVEKVVGMDAMKQDIWGSLDRDQDSAEIIVNLVEELNETKKLLQTEIENQAGESL